MFDRLKENLKQPLSLRWKWGIYLVLVFAPLVLFGLFLFYQQATIKENELVHQHYQMKYENVTSFLESFTYPFQRYSSDYETIDINYAEQMLEQQEAIEFLQYFENEESNIRLFNANNQLIYETEQMNLPSVNHTDQMQPVEHDGEMLLIGFNPCLFRYFWKQNWLISIDYSSSALYRFFAATKRNLLANYASLGYSNFAYIILFESYFPATANLFNQFIRSSGRGEFIRYSSEKA